MLTLTTLLNTHARKEMELTDPIVLKLQCRYQSLYKPHLQVAWSMGRDNKEDKKEPGESMVSKIEQK